MSMKQITYSLAELCNRIEEVHGRIVEPFSLRYPTDPRCRFQLHIYVKSDKLDMRYDVAENGDNVSRLIGMDVVSFSWNEYDNNKVLTVVVREDKNNE